MFIFIQHKRLFLFTHLITLIIEAAFQQIFLSFFLSRCVVRFCKLIINDPENYVETSQSVQYIGMFLLLELIKQANKSFRFCEGGKAQFN